MKKYFVKTPWWIKKMYPHRVWDKSDGEQNIYMSFDDGPTPMVTPFVLDELKKYNAKASFFCIGKNVIAHPDIYQRILDEGHRTGNHTQNHLNGWRTPTKDYLSDITEASKHISSELFRPPYGRMRSKQAKQLRQILGPGAKIIMWDVLSGDFDAAFTAEDCLESVKKNTRAGSIVVFHDSVKAMEKLVVVLPEILSFFTKKGFSFKSL